MMHDASPACGPVPAASPSAIAAERWIASPRTKPRRRFSEGVYEAVDAASNVERLPHRPKPGSQHERTGTGRLIPPTAVWYRSLDRSRSTRAWKAVADQLDIARKAVHAARLEPGRRNLGAALDDYEQAAFEALHVPTRRVSDLRARLSLVAFLAGVEEPAGTAFRKDREERPRLERAFALLDHEIFATAGGLHDNPERELIGRECRKTTANDNAAPKRGEG